MIQCLSYIHHNVIRLLDVLEAHLEQCHNHDSDSDISLPQEYTDNIPDTITLGQAVHTWKTIVYYERDYIQKIRQN